MTSLLERIKALGRHDLLVAVVVLVAVLALAFPEVVFSGKTMLPGGAAGVMGQAPPYGFDGEEPVDNFRLDRGASAWQTEPLTRKVRQAYADLDIPLWNPNVGAGAPLLADMQPAVFNPLRVPVLVSPDPSMWDLYLLGRFLLGGLVAFLFARRMGMVTAAGLVTAVGYILSGHFLLYSNNWWLEVYFSLPLVLYGVESVVRHGRAGGAVLLAAAVAFNLFAGMPEPSMLTLLLAGGYAAYRLAGSMVDKVDLKVVARRGLLLSTGFIAGFALAAPVLLPFWEYVSNAFTPHTPEAQLGLAFDSPRFSISLLVPFFDAPPVDFLRETGWWSGIRSYVGVILPFLAILGLWHRPLGRRAGWFFMAAALLALGKTYGVPGINDLGRLPLANLTAFPQWIAPVIAFCLAFLAGVGADRIFREENLGWSLHLAAALVLAALVSLLLYNQDILDTLSRQEWLWIGLAFGLLLGAWALLWLGRRFGHGWTLHLAGTLVLAGLLALLFLNLDVADNLSLGDWLGKVGLAFGLLAVVWAVLWFGGRLGSKQLGWALLALVAGELLLFAPHGIYKDRYDTFTKPPYVEFLQARQAEEGRSRLFGFDALLFPNNASAYALDDIRNVDALYPERYINYVRTFISPSLRSRFVGGPYASGEGIAQVGNNPLFDLMGAKYILTGANGLYASLPSPLIDDILARVGATPAVRHSGFVINGEEKPVLFAHAPSDLAYELTPTAERQVLRFSMALDPGSWTGEGDGVMFEVAVEGSEPTTVFSQWLDPKSNPADRRWIDGAVDLSPYLGQPVTLHLRTLPGVDSVSDWSGWGDLRLTGAEEAGIEPSQFELVYDDEVRIYENVHAFPRALVFHRVEEVADGEEALARMEQQDFDPAGFAIVEGPIPASVREELAGAPESDRSQVTIRRYEDNRVKLEARMENAGLVMLTDAYFPGWKVYVDGKRANLYPTDYLFRGVFLAEGEHKIEFVYDPASFKLGVAISVVALLSLLGLWGFERYRQRKETADSPDPAER